MPERQRLQFIVDPSVHDIKPVRVMIPSEVCRPSEKRRTGGKARAKKLSKEQLSAEGRKAALARWAKAKNLLLSLGLPFVLANLSKS